MKPDELPEQSTEIPSPENMSWAERKIAEANWRFRVKHMTKSQRRSRVMGLMQFRRPASEVIVVSYRTTDGLDDLWRYGYRRN